MENRFEGIPEHAVRKDATVVVIPMDNPFANCTIRYEHDNQLVATAEDSMGKYDVTEEYEAYLKTLPVIHRVSFEWTEAS